MKEDIAWMEQMDGWNDSYNARFANWKSNPKAIGSAQGILGQRLFVKKHVFM